MTHGPLKKTMRSNIQHGSENGLNGHSYSRDNRLLYDFVNNRRYHAPPDGDGGVTLKLRPDLMLRLDEARGGIERSDAVGAVMEALLQGNARLIDLHSYHQKPLSERKIAEAPSRLCMGSASTPEPDSVPPLPTRGLRDVVDGLCSRASSRRIRLSVGISISLLLLGSLGLNYNLQQAIDARDQAISRLASDSATIEWSYLEFVSALAEIEIMLHGLARDHEGIKRQSLKAMGDRISLLREMLSSRSTDSPSESSKDISQKIGSSTEGRRVFSALGR